MNVDEIKNKHKLTILLITLALIAMLAIIAIPVLTIFHTIRTEEIDSKCADAYWKKTGKIIPPWDEQLKECKDSQNFFYLF